MKNDPNNDLYESSLTSLSLNTFFSENEIIAWKKFILSTNWTFLLNYFNTNATSSGNEQLQNIFKDNPQGIEIEKKWEEKNNKRYTALTITNQSARIFILCSCLDSSSYRNFMEIFNEVKKLLVQDFLNELSEAIRVYMLTNLKTIKEPITKHTLNELLSDIDLGDLFSKVWVHLQEQNKIYEQFTLTFSTTNHYLEIKIMLRNNNTVLFITLDQLT